ncbi:MAG: ribulose-phosphate 3-epimerase [Clostridia bacterium]|nr:ribulose-phosphate 3-epimerase [Clostridia bacterium]
MIKVAPSILAADFANMGKAVEDCEKWGADYIHFDVMDGTFVPQITFGHEMCRALKKHTSLTMDVHLMVEYPETCISQFRDAGADIVTFHIEADRHAHRTLQRIHAAGMKGGIVLNPSTPAEAVRYVLGECDMVLLMSVNPGAGGQAFIPSVLHKIRAIKEMALEMGVEPDIEIDGGINPETGKLCVEAGANVLVAGSSVFRAASPGEMVHALKNL